MCVKEKQVHLECAVHFMVSLSFLGMNLKTFKSKWIWIVNCYELQTCLFNLNNTMFKILIFRQSGHLKVSKCKDCTCIHVKSQDRSLANFKYCSKNNSDRNYKKYGHSWIYFKLAKSPNFKLWALYLYFKIQMEGIHNSICIVLSCACTCI